MPCKLCPYLTGMQALHSHKVERHQRCEFSSALRYSASCVLSSSVRSSLARNLSGCMQAGDNKFSPLRLHTNITATALSPPPSQLLHHILLNPICLLALRAYHPFAPSPIQLLSGRSIRLTNPFAPSPSPSSHSSTSSTSAKTPSFLPSSTTLRHDSLLRRHLGCRLLAEGLREGLREHSHLLRRRSGPAGPSPAPSACDSTESYKALVNDIQRYTQPSNPSQMNRCRYPTNPAA